MSGSSRHIEDLTAQAMLALEEQLAPPADLEARLLDVVAGDLAAQAMLALEEQLAPPADLEARLLDAVAGDLAGQAMLTLEERLAPPANLVAEISSRVDGPAQLQEEPTARSSKRSRWTRNFFAISAAGALACGILVGSYILLRSEPEGALFTEDLVTTQTGLQYQIVVPGSGPAALPGQFVRIHETATLADGTLIYSTRTKNNPVKFLLGANQVIAGVDEGVTGMRVGERRKLVVPPALSKRSVYPPNTVPDATLYYDIELLEILPK